MLQNLAHLVGEFQIQNLVISDSLEISAPLVQAEPFGLFRDYIPVAAIGAGGDLDTVRGRSGWEGPNERFLAELKVMGAGPPRAGQQTGQEGRQAGAWTARQLQGESTCNRQAVLPHSEWGAGALPGQT